MRFQIGFVFLIDSQNDSRKRACRNALRFIVLVRYLFSFIVTLPWTDRVVAIDLLTSKRCRSKAVNNFLHLEKTAGWEDRVATVLLVEDEVFVRNVTREILQAAGYRVLSAGDALAANRLYDEYGPEVDLLLTDMILPGENGTELAASLWRQNPELRVLFVTGYADQIAVLNDAREEYLLKPFCGDVLLRKVGELVDAARAQAEQLGFVMRACVGA